MSRQNPYVNADVGSIGEKVFDDKLRKLLIRTLFATLVLLGYYVFYDIITDDLELALYESLGMLVIGVAIFLTRWMDIARIYYMIIANIVFFVFANLVPYESGVWLFAFPILMLSIILFQRKSLPERMFWAGITLGCFVLLELSDYSLITDQKLTELDDHSTITNLSFTILYIIIIVTFLINVNARTESELIKSYNQQRQLSDQLEEKNQDLVKTNKELDRFVYSTSHDLRSPLMSILGLINIAKEDDKKNGNHEQYLDMMKDRVHKLDNFIQEIIHYSRNSRQDVKKSAVNIEELFDNIINDHQYNEEAGSIKFIKEIDLDGKVSTDHNRLSVIINNLVNNAIKYHDIDQEKPVIILKAHRQNSTLELSVKDNGPGIQDSEQEKIFEMFYRGTDKSNGSGLGLYITREMIEKLNGSIELKSEFSKGAEFKIKVPV